MVVGQSGDGSLYFPRKLKVTEAWNNRDHIFVCSASPMVQPLYKAEQPQVSRRRAIAPAPLRSPTPRKAQ